MNYNEIENYVKELLKQNSDFKMWTKSNRDFIFAPQRQKFGQINIIDFFDKKEPCLIDQEFISNGSAIVLMQPVLVLDSNVVGAIHGFMTQSNSISESLKKDVKEFIYSLILDENHKIYKNIPFRSINQRFYDINPFFYIMECLLKNSTPPSVIDCLKSILMLQMLDYKEFKESKGTIIKKDLSLKEEAIHRYGTFDIDLIAEKQYKSFLSDKKNILEYKYMINYLYLLLLKIAQINLYEENKTPLEKINLTKEYFTKNIGIFSAREIIIAKYYFNNNIGSFIPIKKNDINEVFKVIYNSAIDISLLRMTEFFLHLGSREKINNLVYPVTIEKHLITIGNAQKFKSQYSIKENKFYTLFESDMKMIEKSKDYEKILDNSKYFNEEAFLERFKKDILSPEHVEKEIKDIELSIYQYKYYIDNKNNA